MRWTPKAMAFGLQAMGGLLDGGTLELQDASGAPIASLVLGMPAFQLTGDGSAEAKIVEPAIAERRGPIVGFRAVASDGTPIIEQGTVSIVGAGGDLEMSRTGVMQGDQINPAVIRLEAS